MTNRFKPLDKLPLFAAEAEIATALMGPGKTAEWRQIVSLLERRGLPTIDGLLGGRYTPAIRAFFDREYGLLHHAGLAASASHRPAELGAHARAKAARENDR